jgi:hypothetical protein
MVRSVFAKTCEYVGAAPVEAAGEGVPGWWKREGFSSALS